VPAGKYTLVVLSVSRQELHAEPLTVAPSTTALVRVAADSGGLRGRIAAPDGAPAAQLRGYLWVLPGASEEPADLYEYRRSKRVHRIAVRDGVFEDAGLTPGPAVLVVDLRGRGRVARKAVIPVRSVLQLDLMAGRRVP
jgi:hypothetical protein